MDKLAEALPYEQVVGIGTGEDYAAVTRKAIEQAGGLEDLVKQGDKVIIKPNVVTRSETDQGIVTNYQCWRERKGWASAIWHR